MKLRRLPIYLVLDCSESMAGPAIEEVERGVAALISELRTNPLALETAYLSVITFARHAKVAVPLTEVIQFQPPHLSVRTGTSLGAALRLLQQQMNKEVIRTTPTTKGDYKPLVFLLTDGQPTDDWEPAAEALRRANNPRIANIYAIGCGPDVDFAVLRSVTDIVLSLKEATPEAFRKFFVWLSASVQSASTKLTDGGNAPIETPPLPFDLELVDDRSPGRRDERPRQVFLHARCLKSRKPYLMRFGLRPYDGRYEAIASHPLEGIEEGDGELLPPINSSLLDGCPNCPYCSNPAAGVCSCGCLFCLGPSSRPPIICPGCDSELHQGSSGHFDIHRSQG